jgi:hypothetical protein
MYKQRNSVRLTDLKAGGVEEEVARMWIGFARELLAQPKSLAQKEECSSTEQL